MNETDLEEKSSSIRPEDISRWIYGIVLPVVCVWGILAATLCIVVFTRKQMRSSLNLYLAGLSAFDLVLLTMSILIYIPMQLCVEQGNSGTICHIFWSTALYTYPISLAAQTGSVWTCVAVTVDRFLAVNYPLHSKIWCTPKRATIILVWISALSLAFKVPSFFEVTLEEGTGRLIPTSLRHNPLYITLYMTYGYTLFVLVIPWSIMIMLNVYVVMTVHKAYRIRRSLQTNSTKEEKDRRCTVMALVMILTFVIFNSLAAANNIIEAFGLVQSYGGARISIGNLLVCVNSASNIIVYSLFGRRFRQMCVKMLCGRNQKLLRRFEVTQGLASEWGDTMATRRTSIDQSVGLLSARNSRRYSKRVSLRVMEQHGGKERPSTTCNTLFPDRACV